MLAKKNHAGNAPRLTFIVIDASVSSIPILEVPYRHATLHPTAAG
jgi:hypothetical protein